MNYTELSVTTQDVMPDKGVLFFKSGLTDFIQVGEPIQNDGGLTFVGKLDECGDTFCPNCSRNLVKNGSLKSTLKHVAIGGIHTNIRGPMHVFVVLTLIANSTLEASLSLLKLMVIASPNL
jgi:hypothetical protein